MPKLIIKFQDVIIKEVALDKPCLTIGRKEDNDLCLDHMSVSGRHAKIESKDDRIVLTDTGSTNGTFVNGKKTTEAVLRINDWISIGKYVLYYK